MILQLYTLVNSFIQIFLNFFEKNFITLYIQIEKIIFAQFNDNALTVFTTLHLFVYSFFLFAPRVLVSFCQFLVLPAILKFHINENSSLLLI